MVIEFKINLSEQHVLQKTIVPVQSLEGVLRNDTSVTNPDILIETPFSDISNLIQANYAYIPEFRRYYYITDIVHLRNQLWRVQMKCDPLMSFADGIKMSTVLIEQTTDIGIERVNQYMASDSFVTTVKDKTDVLQFPDGFGDSPYFILITAGGIVS